MCIPQVNKDLPGLKERLDFQASLDHVVRPVSLVHLERVVLRANLGNKESEADQERLGNVENQVQVVKQVHQHCVKEQMFLSNSSSILYTVKSILS